ncbi:MAG: hypothetical protein ACE5IO_09985, partial [Thermoplasmata archaeon]
DFEVYVGKDGETVSYSVFKLVEIESFYTTSVPAYDEMLYYVEGASGIARAHDIPMGTMSFQTYVDNTVSFEISDEMGAISSDKSVVIGKDDFRADLVLLGSGSLTKAGQNISIQMQPDDSFYFRTAYVYENSIGRDIADGRIAGELYVDISNDTLAQAVVEYQPIDMEVKSSSSSEIEIAVDASFPDGKTIILTLEDAVFDVPLEELDVKLDGTLVEKAENVRAVIISSEESYYYALEGNGVTQVFINIPHFSQRTIVLSGIGEAEEAGPDIALGAVASLLLLVAATVFLFKRKD